MYCVFLFPPTYRIKGFLYHPILKQIHLCGQKIIASPPKKNFNRVRDMKGPKEFPDFITWTCMGTLTSIVCL